MTPELQDALVAMIQSGQQELPAVLAEVLLKKTIAAWAFAATERGLSIILATALAWWLVALLWLVVSPARANARAAAIAGMLVLVPAWVALSKLHTATAQGPQLVLFLLLLVVAADVGAYFTGRRFGRRKLAPQVSPGKTWEGVAGGLIAAGAMAVPGIAWPGVSVGPCMVLCVAVVAASVVGDLTDSLFKRHAGLKHSGHLLPGHGGVLDRIDSVTAAAPLFVVGLDRLDVLG